MTNSNDSKFVTTATTTVETTTITTSPKKHRRRHLNDKNNTTSPTPSVVVVTDKKSDKKVKESLEAIQFSEKNNLGRLAVSSSTQSLRKSLASLLEDSELEVENNNLNELKPSPERLLKKRINNNNNNNSDRTQRIDKIQETINNTISGLAQIMSNLPINNNKLSIF